MASRDNNVYFIITATPVTCRWIKSGCICYKKETLYSPPSENVYVLCIGHTEGYWLPVDILQPVTRQKAEFLLALESDEERLKEIAKPEMLEQATELTVGSEVMVAQEGSRLKGVVRYIGPLSDRKIPDSGGGVFFGVELLVSISSFFCL